MPSETKRERALRLAREAGIPLERPFFRDVGPYDITEPMPALERLISLARAEALEEAKAVVKGAWDADEAVANIEALKVERDAD